MSHYGEEDDVYSRFDDGNEPDDAPTPRITKDDPVIAVPVTPTASSAHHNIADTLDDGPRPSFSFRRLWQFTGPGFLMSIAYLDPGNLESDLQAGAFTGYQLLWVLLWSTVYGLFLQILALRLGVVTGRHLAQLCRTEYSPPVRYLLFVMVELAIIGSDLQEVIGSAIAMRVLFGLPLWAGVLITAGDTFTFLFLHAFGVRKLEAFFAALITCMCVCFFVDFGMDPPSAGEMAKGITVTYMQRYALFQAMGLVGSIIMPHNMYLHSALVQSRPVNRSLASHIREATFYFSIEAAVALFISLLINVAVVSVFAKSFFTSTCAVNYQAQVNGQCTDEVGLSNAGEALKSALGNAAQIVWGIGLLASGQSSTMTGVTTGQFVMTGFLKLKLRPWQQLMLTRSIAIVPALVVGVSASSNQTLMDLLDQCINVFMSFQLPFAVLPLLHFTSSHRIMGRFVNRRWMIALGWLSAVLLVPLNVAIVFHMVEETGAAVLAVLSVVCVVYFVFLCYLSVDDCRRLWCWMRGVEAVEGAGWGPMKRRRRRASVPWLDGHSDAELDTDSDGVNAKQLQNEEVEVFD